MNQDFKQEVAEFRIHFLDKLRAGLQTVALRQQVRTAPLAQRQAALEACRIHVAANQFNY